MMYDSGRCGISWGFRMLRYIFFSGVRTWEKKGEKIPGCKIKKNLHIQDGGKGHQAAHKKRLLVLMRTDSWCSLAAYAAKWLPSAAAGLDRRSS